MHNLIKCMTKMRFSIDCVNKLIIITLYHLLAILRAFVVVAIQNGDRTKLSWVSDRGRGLRCLYLDLNLLKRPHIPLNDIMIRQVTYQIGLTSPLRTRQISSFRALSYLLRRQRTSTLHLALLFPTFLH